MEQLKQPEQERHPFGFAGQGLLLFKCKKRGLAKFYDYQHLILSPNGFHAMIHPVPSSIENGKNTIDLEIISDQTQQLSEILH